MRFYDRETEAGRPAVLEQVEFVAGAWPAQTAQATRVVPVVIGEAMACGLPVVAVKEGGVRETVVDEETGFLTQRDPREFAEKIRFLLEHPEITLNYVQQARQHVERLWTWDQAVQELLQNFQCVLRYF